MRPFIFKFQWAPCIFLAPNVFCFQFFNSYFLLRKTQRTYLKLEPDFEPEHVIVSFFLLLLLMLVVVVVAAAADCGSS